MKINFTVLYIFLLLPSSTTQMTRFDKTSLPHTSNSLTLSACNMTTQYAIYLQALKVNELDVCGRLVLSNLVICVVELGNSKKI